MSQLLVIPCFLSVPVFTLQNVPDYGDEKQIMIVARSLFNSYSAFLRSRAGSVIALLRSCHMWFYISTVNIGKYGALRPQAYYGWSWF